MINLDIKQIEKLMEEMANAPREELGKRGPGERQARERYIEPSVGIKVPKGL